MTTEHEATDAKNAPRGEKLQKRLAQLGLGSRRKLEEIIRQGRVSVNQKTAQLGDRAQAGDEIRIDGRLVRQTLGQKKRRRVIAYYKPEGEICSAADPNGRTSVFNRLPRLTQDRWVMVGRLDINSSGLLLFSNDGKLAHRLMHPSYAIEREYAVRVLGNLDQRAAQALCAGVELEDGMARFDFIKEGGGAGVNKWHHVGLKEGRKREVRRLFESQGLKVSRLLRTRYGAIALPRTLKTGRFVELDRAQVNALAASVGLKTHQDAGAKESVRKKQERLSKKPLKARFEKRKNTQSRPKRASKPTAQKRS